MSDRIISLQPISYGTMYGPTSATDGQLIRADGITGDKYQLCTGMIVDDSGNLTSAGNILATIFDTNVAAAGVTLSGTTLSADGTDSNIPIYITPKGTSAVEISKVDIDAGTIDGCTIATSDITVGAGKTLDVSAGTLALADNQISGDKVESGTIAAITIDALTITNTLGVGESSPETIIEITSASPCMTFHCNTESDADESGMSIIWFSREQSGGEETHCAAIKAFHDGSSNDQKGSMVFYTNDGTDDDAPTEAMRIDSSQEVSFAKRIGIPAPASYSDFRIVSTITDISDSEYYSLNVYPTWAPNADVAKDFYGVLCDLNLRHTYSPTGNLTGNYFGGRFRVLNRINTVNVDDLIGGYFLTWNIGTSGSYGNVTNAMVGKFYHQIDGGTLTNCYGVFIHNPAGSGAVTNNYGLFLQSMAKGSSSNYAIYSMGGKSYHAGNFGIATTAPDKPLEINAATGGEIRLTYNDSNGSATDYCDISVGANGELTIASVDSDGAAGDINLKPDGSTTIGDGGTTNYAAFASDGELTLHGTARAWKCQDLTPEALKAPSTNPPAVDEYQGFSFHRFDRGTEEQVYYLWHIPADFAAGDGSVRGHFGFFVENPPSGTGNEAVVMGFEYKKLSCDDVFDFSSGTSSGTLTETITDGEDPYQWHCSDTGVCTTTGWAAEDIILFRFYRDATNGDDTYDNEASAADNDVWVGVYHLEYLRNSLGEAST